MLAGTAFHVLGCGQVTNDRNRGEKKYQNKMHSENMEYQKDEYIHVFSKQEKKNKTEGSVEEPTQSLLNKKDVFTFTIYSKLDPAAQAVNTEKSVR